ncbi:Hypothetical predicted protein [Mytilus galloprovincialis]|uniref:C-type lectin domain-containing protein n=1 Tax=Mytilus galloprovincialis TaxID=29158 RepID=A0A8B6CN05_MYTGA|nr:Hypothetical predicted protein [Mytilus galloprovincialis]
MVGGCPNGWKSFSGHCYLFVYKRITWMNAGIECHNRGGYLVQVDNSHEERWLTSQLKDEVWLGMNDTQNAGHWRWSNKSIVSYTNWRYSEPNGERSENCGCYCKIPVTGLVSIGMTDLTNNWICLPWIRQCTFTF